MKIFAAFACVWLVVGCTSSSVYMADRVDTFKSGSCSVQVFYSQQAASELGEIKEVCVVEGSSVPGFDHSLDGAIKKNISSVCSCGVDLAYIKNQQRENQMGFKGASYVTLVGFRLKD